jgi:hypothetical protein
LESRHYYNNKTGNKYLVIMEQEKPHRMPEHEVVCECDNKGDAGLIKYLLQKYWDTRFERSPK